MGLLNILGFEIAHRINTPAGKIVVLENDEGAKLEITELKKEAGFHALRTNVEDIDSAIEELKANGYEVTEPMEISTGKAILVKDPNGVTVTPK